MSKNYLDPFDPRYPDAAERANSLKTAPIQMVDPTTCPNNITIGSHYRGPGQKCSCYAPNSKQMRSWGYRWNKAKGHYAAVAALALLLATTACTSHRYVWSGNGDTPRDLNQCSYEAVRAVPSSSVFGHHTMVGDVIEIVEAREEVQNACMVSRGYTQVLWQ